MRRNMVVLVVAALVAAACGGSGGSDGTSGGSANAQTITSTDGSATLSIPAGAIGSDIEVTLEPVEVTNVPEGSTAVAFDMQPSGLLFSEPATLSVTIPLAEKAFPAAFVAVGDGVDQGSAVQASATVVGDEVTIEAEIDHFSVATLRIWWVVFPVESDCPAEIAPGDTCHLEIQGIAGYSGMESDFTGIAPYSIVESTQSTATLQCNAETDGPVDAVEIYLQLEWEAMQDAIARITLDPYDQWVLEHTSYSTVWYQQACSTLAAGTGSDPAGDQRDGNTSSPVAEGEGEPGSDIIRVSHRMEDGVHVFTIDVQGDGQALAESESTDWFDVIAQVRGPDGGQWSANATYFGGEQQDRGIRVGAGPEAERVADGMVTLRWVGPGTLEMRVDPGSADPGVDEFEITLISEVDDTNRYDYAQGVAGQ